MTLCPKCKERPSRRVLTYRGKTPHCVECFRGHKAAYDAARRRAKGVPEREFTGLSRSDRDKRAYELKDISAAEIERRYTEALAQIRARRSQALWTWAQRS